MLLMDYKYDGFFAILSVRQYFMGWEMPGKLRAVFDLLIVLAARFDLGALISDSIINNKINF